VFARARAASAVLALAAFGPLACGGGELEPGPPEAEPAAGAEVALAPGPAIRFRDATQGSGLEGFRQVNGDPEKPYIVESIGAGVALLDGDGDGDLDAYFANGRFLEPEDPPARDAYYRGDGRGGFVDGSAEAKVGDTGFTCGVRVADLEGDGDADVYLTAFGPDVLLVNTGGVFGDRTQEAGLGDPRWSTGAAFLDYDADGDLDLYVVNYVAFDRAWIDANAPRQEYRGASVYFGPRGLPGEPDVLYRNDAGRFQDVSEAAGISGSKLAGFQAVVFDTDEDGWVDIFVANDSEPRQLWRNGGDGTFADFGERSGLARSRAGKEQASMGVGVGDATGDGRSDLFVTNFSEDYFTFYENEGRGFFRDVTHRAGLAGPTMASLGWGTVFADFDLDQDLDLFAANGHVYPQVDLFNLGTRYRQRNQVFENLGGGRFREVAPAGGLLVEESSRGSAAGDVDGDGDLDLLVSNLDARPTLLLNESERAGAGLFLTLANSGENRDAVGARVEVESQGVPSAALVATASGFLSSDAPAVCFALGKKGLAERVRVRWPDGIVEEHADLAAGRYLLRRGAPPQELR
jgi:hypothetical protein